MSREKRVEKICDMSGSSKNCCVYVGKAKIKWELCFWFGDKERDL